MENYFWPVVGVLCYIAAIAWDYKLNMKQEDVIKSYFGEEEK